MSHGNESLGYAPPGTDWRSTQVCPRCNGYGTVEIMQSRMHKGGFYKVVPAVHECLLCDGIGNTGYTEPRVGRCSTTSGAARVRALKKQEGRVDKG